MGEPAVTNRWDGARAARMDERELLVYRSNLLGADLRITNFGGGNTSAKLVVEDPRSGDLVRVLYVKGSGGDLGSIALDGFATLELELLLGLEKRYRGRAHEDELVGLVEHCVFARNPRPPSIDTALHAFIPDTHVDHVHPDALIALAACANSEALVREVFAGSVGWLAWQRPGFDLALRIRDLVAANPPLRGIVLAGHGLVSWDRTAEACYANTLALVGMAEDWLAARASDERAFGATRFALLEPRARAAQAARLLPRLRGKLSSRGRVVAHYDDSPEVLAFTDSERLEELARVGTSCPDHFLRTKIRPVVLDADADGAALDEALARYRAEYASYYARCKRPDSPPLRSSDPVIALVPTLGLFAFASDARDARIAAEFYKSAIAVMRGAASVDRYVGLPEQEAFDIEYWALEDAKLRRRPAPLPLAGNVAYVTGGAGGIGRATAARLLADGAHVVLADIDARALETAHADLEARNGPDRVRDVAMDVTDESSVAASFAEAVLAFGGVDIVVSNAGLASSAAVTETTLAVWRKTHDVLVTGYFLVSREAFRLLQAQGLGGSIVFVASKNALVATPGAVAYNTAKAAELHLARSLALEGAPHGIRVNTVNPDAVLQGSRIWAGAWREERARAYGVPVEEIETFYRERSLLKRDVTPEDVAEAIAFFASERSRLSTGNVLNVDAGNATAFTR
ncbi:MAG: bifunctional rhamnulose-1-phosphate aldolase/short-chain dehydrogenase [Myxococcota bacterium]